MLRKFIRLFRPREDRRRIEANNLRRYHDQIACVEAMTQEQWVNQWINSNMQWMPKDMWLAYLKECALQESKKLAFAHIRWSKAA